ncbi:MAG: DUF3644 domain-containing protein [Methylibium sp.]
MKPRKSHADLLALLQQREAQGLSVLFDEILTVTSWKRISLETYLKKGQLSSYLNEDAPGVFAVSNTLGLTAQLFSRNLSQSKTRRDLGFNCKSGLARALLHKARDNMTLALELYNRPSLENRLDGFVLCFCTAWEQLLKAILIERDGENSIFRSKLNPAGIRETISLRECLTAHFAPKSPLRQNIETIAYYRDQAAHLLMPEAQGLMSRIFQSGVMNFGKAFHAFAEQPFIQTGAGGLLSIVGDLSSAPDATIFAKYGKEAGAEVLKILTDLEAQTKEVDDIEFAIPLNVRLVFAKTDVDGSSITLSRAEAGIEGLANATVIEKPVDRSKTHPYRATEAVREINRKISEKFDVEHTAKFLAYPGDVRPKTKISEFDFRVICTKLGWRSSNNGHHYRQYNPEMRYFSERAIDDFIDAIFSQPGYLGNARGAHRK